MDTKNKVKEMRQRTGLSQSKFAAIYGIPVRTLQQWEIAEHNPPQYVLVMLEKLLIYEGYIK